MRSLVLLALVACEPAPSPSPSPSPAPTPSPAPSPSPPPGNTAPAPSTAAKAHRPKELIDHAADFLGKDLVVDIYEPMLDADHSSIAPADGYDVEVTDVGPSRFAVTGVPKRTKPPIRVHGRLVHGDYGLAVIVASWTQLPSPTPEKIAHATDIMIDPAKWSGKVIEVEDTYVAGFEASYIGETGAGKPRIWLDYAQGAEVHCQPTMEGSAMYSYTPRRVHVIGTAYTAGRYGHLGGSDGKIVATQVDYVPCPP
jgi:hypothetical protein